MMGGKYLLTKYIKNRDCDPADQNISPAQMLIINASHQLN
jgi:hypothetical protein